MPFQRASLQVVALLAGWLIGNCGALAADRIDIPIEQTVIHGVIRYSIPVVVGGTTVDALLDTGSVGLRVLADKMFPWSYRPTGRVMTVQFQNGQQLSGPVVHGIVGLGEEAYAVPDLEFQSIETHKCVPQSPLCSSPPAQQKRLAAAMIGEDGFAAIIGIQMPWPASAWIPNPLVKFADAWIITLPLPGQRAPGHLILNPSSDEKSGFNFIPFVEDEKNDHALNENSLPGCLADQTRGQKFCGPITLDTGHPAIRVLAEDSRPNRVLRPGTRAAFSFDGPDGKQSVGKFTVLPDLMISHVFIGHFKDIPLPPPHLLAGIEPYVLFSVLYDFGNGQVGLKPR